MFRMLLAFPLIWISQASNWIALKISGTRRITNAGLIYHPYLGYGFVVSPKPGRWHLDIDDATTALIYHVNEASASERERIQVQAEHESREERQKGRV